MKIDGMPILVGAKKGRTDQRLDVVDGVHLDDLQMREDIVRG